MIKKANGTARLTEGIVFPAYGKKKLLGYADSFCDLAKTFTYKNTTGEKIIEDRQTCLMKRRLLENREILADHLNEMARIMRLLAEESFELYPLKEKEMKKIMHICKENGILIQDICRMVDPVSGIKLAISLRVDDKHVLTAEDAADFLSVLFGKRLLPEKNSLFFLPKEYDTIIFEEEAAYSILTGAAMATQENEKVSGDT